MGSVKDMPYKPTVPNDVFMTTFNQMFGEPTSREKERCPKCREVLFERAETPNIKRHFECPKCGRVSAPKDKKGGKDEKDY